MTDLQNNADGLQMEERGGALKRNTQKLWGNTIANPYICTNSPKLYTLTNTGRYSIIESERNFHESVTAFKYLVDFLSNVLD